MSDQPTSGDRHSISLLANVLSSRVWQAAPDDLGCDDIDERLRHAGASFRSRVRPLTYEEICGLLERYRQTL